MARGSLTLYDYSDRELLLRIADETADGNGVTSLDLALALDIDAKHPGQHVGVRLGWMRRYGAVTCDESTPRQWRLTRIGRALAEGDLDPAQAEVIGGLTAEQMLTLTRHLTNRYRRVGETAAQLMRREFQAGVWHRKHG